MRTLAAGVVVALALVAPAAAQEGVDPSLGGRHAAFCADDVLSFLTETQRPHSPVLHMGLSRYFMGCAYYLPASASPILSMMQADIDTIHRYREDLSDVEGLYREVVCYSWWAIYSSTYQWVLYAYGSDATVNLPHPDDHADACERWISGGSRSGR